MLAKMIPVFFLLSWIVTAFALSPSNTIDHYPGGPTRGDWIVLSSSITISIAMLLVILRLIVKFYVAKKPGWDDCKSSIASILCIP